MNSNAKGARNERRSRKILEAAGYKCVRAGGSLGDWDVVGICDVSFVLLQVKTRDWPGTVEMEALTNFRVPFNCRKLIHRWRDRVREPDVREIE